MGLHADIEHQLKVIDEGLAVLKKLEERSSDARSMIKKARERLAALVAQLPETEGALPPASLPPPLVIDDERRQDILKRLRKVGYVPKVKYR